MVGFALESKCHTGQTIIYDAVGKLGWSVDIRTHRIGTLIERLLIPDWDKQDAASAQSDDNKAAPHQVEVSQVHATEEDDSWFTWMWPWPKLGKGKRGRHGDDDLDSGNPDDKPDENDGKDPDDPEQPPRGSKPPKSHVPKPQINSECRDCFKWEFFDDFGGGT